MPPYVVQTAPQSKNNSDAIAMWAVIAIVIALAVGGGAYLFERSSHPGWGKLSQYEQLASQDGQLAGHNAGWTQGVKQGSTEAKLAGQLAATKASTSGYQSGLTDGISAGQSQAEALSGGGLGLGLGASTYDPTSALDDGTDLSTLDGLSDGLGSSGLTGDDFGLTGNSFGTGNLLDGSSDASAALPYLGSNY